MGCNGAVNWTRRTAAQAVLLGFTLLSFRSLNELRGKVKLERKDRGTYRYRWSRQTWKRWRNQSIRSFHSQVQVEPVEDRQLKLQSFHFNFEPHCNYLIICKSSSWDRQIPSHSALSFLMEITVTRWLRAFSFVEDAPSKDHFFSSFFNLKTVNWFF